MCEILVVFEIENELQRQEFINKIKSLGSWGLGSCPFKRIYC